MATLHSRIMRLVKVLADPTFEIVGPFQVNDDIKVDTISLTEDHLDFEMSIFGLYGEDDFEAIVPSHYLTDEDMKNIIRILEGYLVQ